MKRGKDEEKTMGPMFPRLHVNDTEKGGPRAPPRNKMALYEQLSIPSQRFNGPNSTPGTMNDRQTDSLHFVQQEQKKKHEEDDFRVPIFDQQSATNQNHNGNNQNRENKGITPFGAMFSGRLANVQNAKQKVQKENSQDFPKSTSNQSTRQNIKVPLKETNESSSFGHRNASNNVNLRDYPQADKMLWGESVVNEGIKVISIPVQEQVLTSPIDLTIGDAVSETSMVDSVCGVDISPDDVVGIIGQKHFWKARRAIVNQQRVFAVQVFELHRLIKVQRLIAGSPQLLVEDLAKPAKPAKPSPIKKIPIEYVLKSTPIVAKHKEDCETEFSAENAVGKVSLSSVQNGSQNMNCRPFAGTNPMPPSEPKVGSWGFNHVPGHQWLIPVMSPSEGLVYKPYPGPGFMSPAYGGSTPVTGHNFTNYGALPSDHHYEGPTGVHPFAPPPSSHGYFPPYGMAPMVNPSVSSSRAEQTNPFNLQHQSLSNVSIDKNGASVPNVVKIHASKDSEVQVSTASSRSDRTRGRNALPLFPTSPPPAEPTRVIRVVPHNARSATASVARIFQSIQEERKQ